MTPVDCEHLTLYRDDRYFCAWPFSGGFWQFADGSLCAGFIRGRCDYADAATIGHRVVNCEHGEFVLLRSTDGGRTWPLDSLTTVYTRPAFDAVTDEAPVPREGPPYDPTADGYMLISGYGFGTAKRPQGIFTIVSTDYGHTWSDPIRTPTWIGGARFTFAESRPSTVLRHDGMLLLFGSASRHEDQSRYGTGAHPVVWASWNGGASWGLLAEVDLTPAEPMGILPYPLLLPDGEILLAVRRQYDGYSAHTQLYHSLDGARTWRFLSRVNDFGAPANLALLPDGRIVCVYGYRQQPWGIRARVSPDRGRTWGPELTLRDDGGSWDLGYPRTLVRPDGSLITVYYFNSRHDPVQQDGGVRHIAATLWRV